MNQLPRVLLVDDDQDVLDFLGTLLALEGVPAVQASDAGAALQALSDGQVRLVLMDIAMPGIDGFQLCRQIKRDHGAEGVQVVMVSASTGRHLHEEALAAGADALVHKPFDNDRLLAMVRDRLTGA